MSATATKEVHTISRIAIGKAQADLEETPTDPFLPPQASGSYKVDERVIAGKVAITVLARHLRCFSVSCFWYPGNRCIQLRRIAVG
jgi:hypothetical protein